MQEWLRRVGKDVCCKLFTSPSPCPLPEGEGENTDLQPQSKHAMPVNTIDSPQKQRYNKLINMKIHLTGVLE
jgi:hypothetical protein